MHEMDAVTPRIPVSADRLRPNTMPTGPRRSERQHDYHYSNGVDLRLIPDVDDAPDQHSDVTAGAEVHYIHSFGPDPKDWGEALASPYAAEWIAACLLEKQSFLEHKVYKLVPRAEAKGHKIYKPKSVFKIKINPPTKDNPHATLDKFKFRLTIAAYTKTMKAGIDFEEKRASTVRWEAVLGMIAIAVKYNLDIKLIDISIRSFSMVISQTSSSWSSHRSGRTRTSQQLTTSASWAALCTGFHRPHIALKLNSRTKSLRKKITVNRPPTTASS
jgi:hypothetical protein